MIARLIKHRTSDGVIEMQDDIPIGKIYEVDPATIRRVVVEGPSGDIFEGDIIDEILEGKKAGWIPFELLKLELPS